MNPRRLAVAAAALFLGSVAGLLTVDEGSGTSVVTTAVAATTGTRTASFSLEQRISLAPTQAAGVLTATGKVDFGARRVAATLTPSPPGAPTNLVIDGSTTYIQATGAYAAAARGKAWVVLPGAGGAGMPSVGPAGAADPLASLEMLRRRGGLRSVAEEGSDEVRGVRVTRYRAEVDPDEAVGAFRGLGVVEARATVWISDDGLVRRMRLSTTIAPGGGAGAGAGAPGSVGRWTAETTLELFDFGTPVRVDVPPPDQVHRLGDFPR